MFDARSANQASSCFPLTRDLCSCVYCFRNGWKVSFGTEALDIRVARVSVCEVSCTGCTHLGVYTTTACKGIVGDEALNSVKSNTKTLKLFFFGKLSTRIRDSLVLLNTTQSKSSP